MADPKSIWPDLPEGWSYGTAEQQVGDFGAAPDKNADVGSLFRQVQGPQQSEQDVTFTNNFLKPVGEKLFDTVVPHTPADLGIFAASLIFGGPGSLALRGAARLAPGTVPLLESLGATGVRRVLGTGVGGAVGALVGGQDPVTGGASGAITQLIGGEGVSKLTKFLRMNAQAVDLAKEDPERLGQVVEGIIPNLKGLKTANDFHAAFNSGGAQQVLSEAYRKGMSEVSAAVGQAPIRSGLITEMRSAGVMPQPGSVLANVGRDPNMNLIQTSADPATAVYSFDDAVETLKRLRSVGWTQEEAARGLAARDAREAADQLSREIMSQIPPDVAEKFASTDLMYARGQKLKRLISDKSLLDKNGELNVPRLQAKFKAEGYNPRESMEMAADALSLKEALFRGSDQMIEDVPGQPGKIFDHFRLHFGIIPTMYPSLPKLGRYAGRANYGVTPGDASQISQMLKRGVQSKPITLGADDE